MNDKILKYVKDFEERYNTTAFVVSDSGSRAWGYAHKNSDYDVKVGFIYNDLNKYLSLFSSQEDMTWQPEDSIDLTFWDVRKIMNLLWKGNAQVYELIYSPSVYRFNVDPNFIQFVEVELNRKLHNVAYHYYGLAKKTMSKIEDGSYGLKEPKKTIYALKATLQTNQILKEKRLPLLSVNNLIEHSFESGFMNNHVYQLSKTLVHERCKLNDASLNEYVKNTLRKCHVSLDNGDLLQSNSLDVVLQKEKYDTVFRNVVEYYINKTERV